MSPARRFRRLNYIKLKNRKKTIKSGFKSSLFRILGLFFLVLTIVLFVHLSSKEWNGKDHVAVAFPAGNDVSVIVFDPAVSEMTVLTIPGDTQVEVAASYGTLRLKNVWQLGVNEKLDGKLLAKTITKNFLFPVYLWSEDGAQSMKEVNLVGLLKFVLFPKKTNLNFGDRLQLALFSIRVNNIDKTEIDLARNQFVKKSTLSDGLLGFVLPGQTLSRLTVYFADDRFLGNQGSSLRTNIIDKTAYFGAAQKVGEVVEVLGGKVVSIDKSMEKSEVDCLVRGNYSKAIYTISKVFDCTKVKGETSFDLEIVIGGNFGKNF